MKITEKLAEEYVKSVWEGRGGRDIKVAAKLAYISGYEKANIKWKNLCMKENRQPTSAWVSVKTKLPEIGDLAVRYSPSRGVDTGRFGGELDDGTILFSDCTDATYWLPIPKGPWQILTEWREKRRIEKEREKESGGKNE